MTKRRAWIALFVLGPWLAYELLRWGLPGEAAPLMLGSTADSDVVPLMAMATALALRLYTVVVLPSVVVFVLAAWGIRRLRRPGRTDP